MRLLPLLPPRLALGLITLASLAQAAPPVFPPGDLVTDYAGVKVADPYRALENTEAPATRDWVRAQASHTRQRLDALPGRAALARRITALDASRAPAISALQVADSGALFYLKRLPGGRSFKLYTRPSSNGAERLLLDPEAWEKQLGTPHAINNFSVAPDGRHLAAVVSQADAELGELRLIDTGTGQAVRPALPGIWGELPAAWLPDGQSVLIAQGADALTPGGRPFGKMQLRQRYLSERPDRLMLGHGLGFGPEVRPTDWVFVDAAGGSDHVLALMVEGVSANLRLAVARRDEWLRDPASARWRLVVDVDAAARDAVIHGHHLYVRSYLDAPRYRLLRYDLDQPALPPVAVLPERDGVIDGLTAAADGLYVLERRGAVTELLRLPYDADAGEAQRVALPFVGSAAIFEANPRRPGLVFTLEGWTRPQSVLSTRELAVADTGLVPPDRSGIGRDWVSEESECNTQDGEQVPMSLIYKRGLRRDSLRPTIIDGYGGYGISEPAYFNRRLDAWLQRGGVWVDVKPRGGGALGRDWYQAGVGPLKSNTWKDMLACARTLIERGITQPSRLAITGTSMGGVAVGRAITDRPDLFAAALIRVGITDAVRFIEATDNGPNHATEMGTVDTEAGIRQLLAMSTYHQIRDGTRYPAVLFTTGVNDHRVAPWLAYKTFARLSAATASGKPVLLRVDMAGGHGVSTTASQRNAEFADLLSFVLWNVGDKDFQPRR